MSISFPFSSKNKKNTQESLTLINNLLVPLVPDYPGLGPGVPCPAADLPLRAGVHCDPGVRVDQLQLGGRNWKIKIVWFNLKLQ